jgi:hypothetical protein
MTGCSDGAEQGEVEEVGRWAVRRFRILSFYGLDDSRLEAGLQ